MKNPTFRIAVALSIFVLIACGCGKKGPPELTLEQVPDAIRTAFTGARQALGTNAEGIAKLISQNQFAAASLQLQALAANTDLTDEQRNVLASATIAVNGKLQELAAAVQPPPEIAGPVPSATRAPVAKEEAAAAAAVLEYHIRTK